MPLASMQNPYEYRGFLSSTIAAINAGPESHPGVMLGKAMLAKQLSVVAVAKELGIAKQTLHRLIVGKTYPRPDTHERIQQFLNTLE